MNVWTGDRSVNQLPSLDTISLSFLTYNDMYDCSNNWLFVVKVIAINPNDPDWNITRLKFYYYNVDDPDRILEYKESWFFTPYTYFTIPKTAWEYRFWVILYDNNWWIINSDDIIWKWPVVYIPASCGDLDVPIVTLKIDSTDVKVWDTVTYTIKSRVESDNKAFEKDRTFYYDFDGNWTWDLVTKKDSAEYVFEESYENWITPRAAVEFRWKLWQALWNKIYVEQKTKPILLYNSIWNTVIFRDLSMWKIQQREICFETDECEAWNKNFKRIHVNSIGTEYLDNWEESIFSRNDSFIWNYNDYWKHKISISLKNVYWEEEKSIYVLETNNNKNNWRIAPGVYMITIPETTITNQNPEIFLSKNMKNTLLMYINNDNDEICYVDTDISTDSDWDGKDDNDMDIMCNKIAKIVYEPNYESAIWRVYFTNNWQLTFKNFYVTFEWSMLELDEQQLEIYNDITMLVNEIEDLCMENVDLKQFLDKLRKNLNNRLEVSSLVAQIYEHIDNWWIKIDIKQAEMLYSILNRLSNEDTIVSVWMNEYEKNREKILASLEDQWSIKTKVEGMFQNFNESAYQYSPEEKGKELEKIRNTIIKDWKKNKWLDSSDNNIFTQYFCNIFDYYEITRYTAKC